MPLGYTRLSLRSQSVNAATLWDIPTGWSVAALCSPLEYWPVAPAGRVG